MENISLLNRKPNFNENAVQSINSKNNIIEIDKVTEKRINDPFVRLQNSDKSISNLSDLREMSSLRNKEELAKRRVLEKKENGGYILMGSLTCMGITAIGTIIFMAIKSILMK